MIVKIWITVATGYNEPSVPEGLVRYIANSLYNIHFIYRTVRYIKLTNKNLSRDISSFILLFRYTVKFYYNYYCSNYITLKSLKLFDIILLN